jgi:hypothetical protein
MFVDPEELRAGAVQSYNAAERANDGAGHLSRSTVTSGIFGDFAGAHAFHEVVAAAHTRHAKLLIEHSEVLEQLGINAHKAASGFTEMDDRSAKQLHGIAEQL